MIARDNFWFQKLATWRHRSVLCLAQIFLTDTKLIVCFGEVHERSLDQRGLLYMSGLFDVIYKISSIIHEDYVSNLDVISENLLAQSASKIFKIGKNMFLSNFRFCFLVFVSFQDF